MKSARLKVPKAKSFFASSKPSTVKPSPSNSAFKPPWPIMYTFFFTLFNRRYAAVQYAVLVQSNPSHSSNYACTSSNELA